MIRVCRRCSENVPDVDFPKAEKLGGFDPWCNACWTEFRSLTGEDHDKALLDWKRDRMWAYIKARRVSSGMAQRIQYHIISKGWAAKLFVQKTLDVAQLRIRCKWSAKGKVRNDLLVRLGVDPVDITLFGRGGGKGYREQPIAELRTQMSRERWDVVFANLSRELTVQEVRA